MLMRTGLTIEDKVVSDECRNQFPGTEASESSIIDSHRLDRYGNFCFRGHLYFLGGFCGDWFSMLNEALHHHLDDLMHML